MRTYRAEDLAEMIDPEREYSGYPLTICASRYRGVYEGARYVAFPLDPDTIGSTDYASEDIECAQFWADSDRARLPFGRGGSPDEALADLLARMKAWSERRKHPRVIGTGGGRARTEELRRRITRNPAILGGKPIIRGMRVTVGTILGQLAAGTSRREVLDLYPYLEEEDIDAVLRFALDVYESSEE
jgi:uncharacterized protein (DUF433 family)